jgi:putative aminopeptidase FrvX
MPTPPGTKYRVKTIIKKSGEKAKLRLAFDPKGNVIEHKKLFKKDGKWKSRG